MSERMAFNDGFDKGYTKFLDRLIALKTANADLLEALEPFVADWENSWLGDDNDKADPDGSYGHSAKLTAGDVRKAREAIRKHKGEVK